MKKTFVLLVLLVAFFETSYSSKASSSASGSINGHEYVDLGLSVKWATCNVGASSPSDYGNYYAWGETKTKSEYTERNSVTYGKQMGSIAGNPQYDAATANWGGTWRMPTEEEIGELEDKCTWRWVEKSGHGGYEVTGPNGNSIFLPAAGWLDGSSLYAVGKGGYYWSALPDEDLTDFAYGLHFYGGDFVRDWNVRSGGQSVRPVMGQPTTSSATKSTSSSATSPSGKISGHDYVNLGLSVKWATCNVGASSPSDYGNYFAWGETKTKSEYTSDNSVTYGKTMGSIAGDPQYDAARANWGGTWRMPTKEEIDELVNKCTWKWVEKNGHEGYEVTGPNGNSIFLPAAGCRNGSSLNLVGGVYWDATPDGDHVGIAYGLHFSKGAFSRYWHGRYYGQSVRPVSD